jgi:hypothetical protein
MHRFVAQRARPALRENFCGVSSLQKYFAKATFHGDVINMWPSVRGGNTEQTRVRFMLPGVIQRNQVFLTGGLININCKWIMTNVSWR